MMKGGIASYLASLQGMEMVQTSISPKEGQTAIGEFLENLPWEADSEGDTAAGSGKHRPYRFQNMARPLSMISSVDMPVVPDSIRARMPLVIWYTIMAWN